MKFLRTIPTEIHHILIYQGEKAELDEGWRWIRDNITGVVHWQSIYHDLMPSGSHLGVFYFNDPRDAMRIRLTWP
jgi:hypothetical protein